MADHWQALLFPNLKDMRFWRKLYGHGDEEINGRYAAMSAPLPALSIVQNLEDDPGLPLSAFHSDGTLLPSPASSPALTPTLAPMRSYCSLLASASASGLCPASCSIYLECAFDCLPVDDSSCARGEEMVVGQLL